MLPTHLIYSEDHRHHHLANIACGGPDLKTLYITESLSGDILMAKYRLPAKNFRASIAAAAINGMHSAAFHTGVRESFGVPGGVLAASYIGFGALAFSSAIRWGSSSFDDHHMGAAGATHDGRHVAHRRAHDSASDLAVW